MGEQITIPRQTKDVPIEGATGEVITEVRVYPGFSPGEAQVATNKFLGLNSEERQAFLRVYLQRMQESRSGNGNGKGNGNGYHPQEA